VLAGVIVSAVGSARTDQEYESLPAQIDQ